MNDEQRLDKELDAFLESTIELLKFFPDGMDFDIDPYDPTVQELTEMLNEMDPDDELMDIEASSQVPTFIVRGVNRHIDIHKRFEVHQKLYMASKKQRLTTEEQALLEKTQLLLSDMTIHPVVIPLVIHLFINYLANLAMEREVEYDAKLKEWVDRYVESPEPELAKEILKYGDQAVRAIEDTVYDDEEFNPANLSKLQHLILQIPSFYSACICKYAFIDTGIPTEAIDIMQESGLLLYFRAYVLNDLENPQTTVFFRWRIYHFLGEIGYYDAHEYMQYEFTRPQFWTTSFHDMDDEEEMGNFFSDIIAAWSKIGDRRCVPLLVKVLVDGKSMEIPKGALQMIREKVSQTQWAAEIEQNCRLYQDGETVFLQADPDEDMLPNPIYEGEPVETQDMDDDLSYAYHESLGGLRLVDLPESDLETQIMNHLTRDFKKKLHKYNEIESEEELEEQFAEYTSSWLSSPQKAFGYQIPLVLLDRDLRRIADENIIWRIHYEQEFKQNLEKLHQTALFAEQVGDFREAAKYSEIVLNIDPTHPFANLMKKQLKKKR